MIRPFGTEVVLPKLDDNFAKWVTLHDRPSVVPLDDRSISHVFRDGNSGILFFIDPNFKNKTIEFTRAAE